MIQLSEKDIYLIVENNREYIKTLFSNPIQKMYYLTNSKIKKLYKELQRDLNYDEELAIYKTLIPLINVMRFHYIGRIFKDFLEDCKIKISQGKKRSVIDSRTSIGYDELAVACIIKDEARYIKEFLEFHLMMGVQRFYIFNNDSADNILKVLKPYVEAGVVVLIHFPGKKVQCAAYRFAIKYCRKNTRWLAFIDADEFLFSPSGKLPQMLEEYKDYPGVGVNWVSFGPSGHDLRPEGLVVNNYRQTFADFNHLYNRRIKSIVQPNKVRSIYSPHFCIYKHGSFAVDENKHAIDGAAAYIPGYGLAFTFQNNREKIRINHYMTKSKEDLRKKCQRGYPDGCVNPDYEKSLKRFDELLYEDETILKYVSELENRM